MDTEAMLAHAVRIVTMVGVIIAAVQLFRQVREHRTAFEDRFAKEYRELLASIPVKAMLGERLDVTELETSLPLFYHYFDLCNEQAFLARTRRVRPRTWRFWREGIEDNLERPAFRQAWDFIEPRTPSDFSELRTLIARRRK
ncbi:MAG: hypothetical protein ACREH4_02940, partial [Vitreimonas sp.]